jgi:hypothetical protein
MGRLAGPAHCGASGRSSRFAEDRNEAKTQPEEHMQQPKRSPWGQIDYWREVAPGIALAQTPGHGGFKLDRKRNNRVPASCRRKGGWYEEDCEWGIVALVHPDAFKPDEVTQAHQVVKNYFPEAYTAITGAPVAISESWQLRALRFEETTRDVYVACSAFGDWAHWVPEGMVGVYAVRRRNRDEACFLIPQSEYACHGEFSFVVDESRHERVEEPTEPGRTKQCASS